MKKKILILLAVLASCASVHGVEAMDEDGTKFGKDSTIFRQNLEPSNMETQIQPVDKQEHGQQEDVMKEDQEKTSSEADKEKVQKKTYYVRGSLGLSGL